MKTSARHSEPLYQRVADDIVSQVETGRLHPGDRLPSERALCERYSVSQITVRRALRELAHAGRVYSQHGLGWFITEPEPDARRHVTLLLADLDWLTAPVVRHLSRVLAADGLALRLVFAEPGVSGYAAAQDALNDQPAALLWAVPPGERLQESALARLLVGVDLPGVLLYRAVQGVEMPVVSLDERRCTERLTRHLLALGHQRLAYVGGEVGGAEEQQQYWGFAATLLEQGLELPLDWVFKGRLVAGGEGERLRRSLHAEPRPTALICSSDLCAAEALRLLAVEGLRCPEDVAVVGLGDREFSPLLSTPLTTMRYDLAALGRAGAAVVMRLLAGRPVESASIGGQLVVRHSCGAGRVTHQAGAR